MAEKTEECDEMCQYLQDYSLNTNDSYVNEEVNQGDDTCDWAKDHPIFYVTHQVCLPVICVVGILAIILTIIVLNRKSMWTSTNCYLTALAIADLVFLMFLATKVLDGKIEYHVFEMYFHYAEIMINTCLIVSVWLTVVLGIERYIAICQPLHATMICTVRRARIVTVLIFLLAFACRSPLFFEKTITIETDVNNKTSMRLEVNQVMDNNHYLAAYGWIVDFFITAVLPFLLLSVLNIRLIYEVRKSTLYMKRHLIPIHDMRNLVKREELKITVMLIAIIVVFFLLQAPFVICNAIYAIPNLWYWQSTCWFQIFRMVAIILIAVKTAVNFALYCWFSERFWTTFKKIFCIEQCMVRYYVAGKKPTEGTTNGSSHTVPRKSSAMSSGWSGSAWLAYWTNKADSSSSQQQYV
ncbi:sex peptide receptor-like isoform X2 [Lineus longissimus]|uniref:sex peptide receptor-like isoform X2 n=1 Tax=Lineus longissimus TaxID=88925 RepID=UPI00315CCE69